MKLVAIEGISLSAQHIVRPGEAFELDDARCCAELLAIGAARAADEAPDTTADEAVPGAAVSAAPGVATPPAPRARRK